MRHPDPRQPDTTRDDTVAGTTCPHCMPSVREEVAEAGVRDVDVDLASGRPTVTGERVSDEAVTAAVADAGLEVVR